MAERVECPECGGEVAVRKDGTLYTHKDDGVQCPGSGEPGGVSGTVGLDKGDDFEDTEDVQEEAPEVEAAGPAPVGGFEWKATVKAPCPYLNDPGWHLANGRAAEQAARAAGHTPAGEAVHADTTASADGRTLTVTYRVLV